MHISKKISEKVLNIWKLNNNPLNNLCSNNFFRRRIFEVNENENTSNKTYRMSLRQYLEENVLAYIREEKNLKQMTLASALINEKHQSILIPK